MRAKSASVSLGSIDHAVTRSTLSSRVKNLHPGRTIALPLLSRWQVSCARVALEPATRADLDTNTIRRTISDGSLGKHHRIRKLSANQSRHAQDAGAHRLWPGRPARNGSPRRPHTKSSLTG